VVLGLALLESEFCLNGTGAIRSPSCAWTLQPRHAEGVARETGVLYDHLRKAPAIHTDAGEFEAATRGRTVPATAAKCTSRAWRNAWNSSRLCAAPDDRPRRAGTYSPDDESGDAHQFTGNLPSHAGSRACQFGYEHSIETLSMEGDTVIGAVVRDPRAGAELVKADAFWCAGRIVPLPGTADADPG